MATLDLETTVTKYVWFKNVDFPQVKKKLDDFGIRIEQKDPQPFYSLKINGPESAINEFSKVTFIRPTRAASQSADDTNDLVVRSSSPTVIDSKYI